MTGYLPGVRRPSALPAIPRCPRDRTELGRRSWLPAGPKPANGGRAGLGQHGGSGRPPGLWHTQAAPCAVSRPRPVGCDGDVRLGSELTELTDFPEPRAERRQMTGTPQSSVDTRQCVPNPCKRDEETGNVREIRSAKRDRLVT